MAQVQELSRPPITEALVDIRTSLVPSFRPETFLSARGELASEFPSQEEIRQFEARIEIVKGKPAPPQQSLSDLRGYMFRSADGKSICQFRIDGFTYNRLAPYTSWTEVRAQALRLWGVFVGIARPNRADRVALRYINRLELPVAGQLGDYLAIQPPVFPGVPHHMASFLFRLSARDPESDLGANVVQSLEPSIDTATATLILDIDVYYPMAHGVAESELASALDSLRRVKNEIFFGMITDETVARYR